MAPPTAARTDRPWRALALGLALLAHAPALTDGLLDADRLLLTRNPLLRTFGGLATMVTEGRVLLRGAGLPVRDHAPLGALGSWLSWEWLRASPFAQHAVGLALLLWVVASLFDLLRALRLPARGAALAALAVALAPCAADLTGAVAHRDALLALALTLAVAAPAPLHCPRSGAARTAAVSLVAGLCAPGYGLLGLLPASVLREGRLRAIAAASTVVTTLLALSLTHGPTPSFDALTTGAAAALLAWLPSATPFVAAGAPAGAAFAWFVPPALAAVALVLAARAADPLDAALLRAGAAAFAAGLLAAACAGAASAAVGAPALVLQLGLVLVGAGLLRPHGAAIAARARPWMLVALALPAAATAARARGWRDEDAALRAIVARDPRDPEAALARARGEIRRGRLGAATPWCLRYALARPATGRADGCVGADVAARGDHRAAVTLLRRWAAALDDRRALREAALELSDACPDPRFAAAFREATGYSLPRRRPGEAR